MSEIKWRPQARIDLLTIVAHIATDNPTAAQELKNAIELADHPELFRRGRIKGTRELTAHPNYIVIYRIIGKTVEVLRIKHAAQKFYG